MPVGGKEAPERWKSCIFIELCVGGAEMVAKRDVLVAKRHQRTRKAPEILHFYRVVRRKRRVGGKLDVLVAKRGLLVAKRGLLVANSTCWWQDATCWWQKTVCWWQNWTC